MGEEHDSFKDSKMFKKWASNAAYVKNSKAAQADSKTATTKNDHAESARDRIHLGLQAPSYSAANDHLSAAANDHLSAAANDHLSAAAGHIEQANKGSSRRELLSAGADEIAAKKSNIANRGTSADKHNEAAKAHVDAALSSTNAKDAKEHLLKAHEHMGAATAESKGRIGTSMSEFNHASKSTGGGSDEYNRDDKGQFAPK